MKKVCSKVIKLILMLILTVSLMGNSIFVNIYAINQEEDILLESREPRDFDIIADGTYGTSNWRIESDGTLYIGGGEFASNDRVVSPWNNYAGDVTKIVFEDNVVAIGSQQFLFAHFNNVTTIEGLDYLDVSNVSNLYAAFLNMRSLTRLDLSNFNTSNITHMDDMLTNLTSLKELTLGENFNIIGNVTLPNIPDTTLYTGFWQNVGDGTVENPQGEYVLTSKELIDQYNGATMADTYVWQLESPTFDTTILVLGEGSARASKETNVIEGETITLTAEETGSERFVGWYVESGNVILENESALTTAFVNTGENVKITAMFEKVYTNTLLFFYDGNIYLLGTFEQFENLYVGIQPSALLPDYNIKGLIVLEGNITLTVSDDELLYEYFQPNEDVTILIVIDSNDNSILNDNFLYSANNFEVNLSEVMSGLSNEELIEKANVTMINVLTGEAIRNNVTAGNSPLNTAGTHSITFTYISMLASEELMTITVEVIVLDDIAPEITTNQSCMTIDIGSELPISWTELFGVIAEDETDGIITGNITYDVDITDIDMSTPATHTIIARVVDRTGNSSEVELTLVIKELITDKPIIEELVTEEAEVDKSTAKSTETSTSPNTGDKTNLLGLYVLFTVSFGVTILLTTRKMNPQKRNKNSKYPSN